MLLAAGALLVVPLALPLLDGYGHRAATRLLDASYAIAKVQVSGSRLGCAFRAHGFAGRVLASV